MSSLILICKWTPSHVKKKATKCGPPTKVRMGVELEFWVFRGGQNIFDFREGVALWGGGVYFVRGGQFILHSFSHFEMQDFKNLKNFVCSTVSFNILIFRFKIDAGLQVDIDFNTESKFSFSRSSVFSPLSGQ